MWGADITPDETRTRPGSGFCVKLDKGEFIGREALVARPRRTGRPPRLCCLVLDDPRAVALSATSRCASTARSSGRVTSGGYGYTVGRVDRLRLPAARARRARDRGRGRDLRRVGRRAGSSASRCSTRRASACGPRTNCPWRPRPGSPDHGRMSTSPSERIIAEVTAWPGVTPAPARAASCRSGRQARDRPPARRPCRPLRLPQGRLRGCCCDPGPGRPAPGLPRQGRLGRAADRGRRRRATT